MPTADALHIIEQAIAKSGGAKVMLRLDEAAAIRKALKAEPPPVCALQAQGLPCVCGLCDPHCEHRQAG